MADAVPPTPPLWDSPLDRAVDRAVAWGRRLLQGPEPEKRSKDHPNEPTWKMAGEVAREAGILLMVFTYLDAQKVSTYGMIGFELAGAALLVMGIIIERRRELKGRDS